MVLEVARSRVTGERFVRASYNDEVLLFRRGEEVSQWQSMDSFLEMLRPLRISHEEYRGHCTASNSSQQRPSGKNVL